MPEPGRARSRTCAGVSRSILPWRAYTTTSGSRWCAGVSLKRPYRCCSAESRVSRGWRPCTRTPDSPCSSWAEATRLAPIFCARSRSTPRWPRRARSLREPVFERSPETERTTSARRCSAKPTNVDLGRWGGQLHNGAAEGVPRHLTSTGARVAANAETGGRVTPSLRPPRIRVLAGLVASALCLAVSSRAQPYAAFEVPDSLLQDSLRHSAAGFENAWNTLLVSELRATEARADSVAALRTLERRVASQEEAALGSHIARDA